MRKEGFEDEGIYVGLRASHGRNPFSARGEDNDDAKTALFQSKLHLDEHLSDHGGSRGLCLSTVGAAWLGPLTCPSSKGVAGRLSKPGRRRRGTGGLSMIRTACRIASENEDPGGRLGTVRTTKKTGPDQTRLPQQISVDTISTPGPSMNESRSETPEISGRAYSMVGCFASRENKPDQNPLSDMCVLAGSPDGGHYRRVCFGLLDDLLTSRQPHTVGGLGNIRRPMEHPGTSQVLPKSKTPEQQAGWFLRYEGTKEVFFSP
ncbi:hypothetical protein B0T24DRAFT_613038 [Lasiosphaeria ovina]|uniref:Uncharacterized protein n=1 Tax=Lasiosphaeria ovina TaxID=92902 RepID=A0AAE0NE25_9PEZI|nr:hypothetical protein B0T24DRAFT_613038 [Lasiosphaeria ovina]